jgi:DNA-binding transcriptional LysR family regulator
MTLVQLQHLIALARSGSFSQAASAVFLTQSALSRSIRALEDELGQALFDRIGRRSELTPFGREVLARAQRLVDDADDIKTSGRLMKEGHAGVIRLGLGSGPGAMLMTPLLMRMATQYPGIHVDISRGSTELLVQALRTKALDALVVDARSLKPAADLSIEVLHEMRGAFLCRRGHPLVRKRQPLTFEMLKHFPLASTPLSDEVARILMERYGPQAHPALCITLRCDEIPSLVDVVRQSDAILLAIRAAAPDLIELTVQPALAAMARFGLVTLAGRTGSPTLQIVRTLMQDLLHD